MQLRYVAHTDVKDVLRTIDGRIDFTNPNYLAVMPHGSKIVVRIPRTDVLGPVVED